MTPFEQAQEARIAALEKGQQQILALLGPISETYKTVASLGKWASAILVFISVVVGILLGLKDLKQH